MKEIINKYKENRVNLSNAQIINILLISIVTIVPYIVTKSIKPVYLMGKVYYLYIVSVLLVVFLCNLVKVIKIKFEEKIIISFLITMLISTIFSNFKNIAFWGNNFRKEGFIMFCIYILLFILTINFININKKIKRIILFLPNIMAIYSIIEFYGYSPLKQYLNVVVLEPAAMGTVGNRNFYSTYLLIFLILNFSLYILKGKKENLINSTIQFTSLICALSRSCWVAFFIVSIIGGIFIYKDKQKMKRALSIFILFSSIFLILNITSSKLLSSRVESLVDSTVNVNETSGSGRILIWKIVGELIFQNPILGEGPDTLRESINMYIPDRMDYFQSISIFQIDKAHNEYLEYWASSGILTMILYITLIIVIGKNILINIDKIKYKVLFLVFIAYVVQAFFNISMPSVAPIWWIFLGYCVQSYRSDEIKGNESNMKT